MPRLSNESVTQAQIGSVKRATRGKTVDSMAISKANKSKSLITQAPTERKSTARPRKAKRRSFENTETDSKSDYSPIMMKQRAVSDSAFLGRPQAEKSFYNSSGLKVEAFDYFHEMLNQCCGSHKLNVLEAASILKQFTPEVIKTVIYVIAENAKNNTSTQLQESQSQTADADEFPDIEISKISGATRRRSRGKWQQVPELIQPRLTSPVSNSCSPVSAAVQALMSFARPDAEEKGLSSSADFDASSRGQVEEQRDHEEEAEKTNLNVFDTDSMTAISGSPFLQPMSSMVMLHTEPEKPQSCADALSSESDQDKPAFISSVRDALTSSSSSCLSPHFPWTQSPTSKITSEREKISRNTDKYLPSISSILGPINAPFSELPFSLQTTLPVFGISRAASKISASQSHFPQSPLSQDAGTTGAAVQGVLEHPSSASNLLFASSNMNLKNQNLQKTVFRAILPKPIDQIIKVENKPKIADKMLNLLSIDPSSEQSRNQHFGQAMSSDDHIAAMAQCIPPDMLSSLTAKPVLLAPLTKQEPFDTDHQTILPKPLYSVMSSSRERGLNTKGIVPNRATSAVGTKGKKSSTSGNNSGNLEVASALLSMGSTESKGKKSAKIVSSFNREKATFEIEESSQAQRSNILFTATGTFQIEDIEIDPKKNKIEKDSYECGKCGRVFTSLVYLARHIKRVCPDMSLRKWKCDRCEKAFRHPFGLQQHIYTHTGERPYKCDQCSKAFYSANDLRRHKRTHSGERPYSCSHCKKAFSTTISLKTHTYIHTGERPHKCPHCPKTFATSSKLSRHVVTHSDKRPFSCDTCVKTFNRSGDLRRHYNNVHNMEHGLLGCDQCNKLFATQKCLQIHKATHNRIGREKSSLDVRLMSEASDVASISELIPGNYTLKASLDD